MKIDINSCQAKPNTKINLRKIPSETRLHLSKEAAEDKMKLLIKKMSELQDKMYAASTYSLLLVFQAMDAAGKDAAIKNVMAGINPQGSQVFSFKHPSAEELDHDFLWRAYKSLPERGRIGIFNRSYYEEVLIVRVHPEILKAQNLPHALKKKDLWKSRYESIRNFEAHLGANGTKVVKFFLHVSKEEQRKRFLERIENPAKNWKFSAADLKERGFWNDYQEAYEDCIAATTTKDAPWYIIPADDKTRAQLLIAQIVVNTLEDFKMSYPKLSKEQQMELQKFGQLLKNRN